MTATEAEVCETCSRGLLGAGLSEGLCASNNGPTRPYCPRDQAVEAPAGSGDYIARRPVRRGSACALLPLGRPHGLLAGLPRRQVPSTPKFDFSVSETWNTGVQATMSALSVAPRKIQEYTQDGWKYMKGLIK
ncbi:MICOS complex subunit MIC13 isoform X1 [Pelodiscus sinensis]|uniref:MICOS complex subunit MIC13 isoform X1 n=1 Tax=Pelodiscus sinensis TaxID=13735 RepID=UPI003F6C4E09